MDAFKNNKWLTLWVSHWIIHSTNSFKTRMHSKIKKWLSLWVSQWIIHSTNSLKSRMHSKIKKWLTFWLRHWIIHSNDLFKNIDSFRNISARKTFKPSILIFVLEIFSFGGAKITANFVSVLTSCLQNGWIKERSHYCIHLTNIPESC